VFHGFGREKFADSDLALGYNQLSLLLELPLETMLNLKLVKIELNQKQSSCFFNLNP